VHDSIPIGTLPVTADYLLRGEAVKSAGWGMKSSGIIPRYLEYGVVLTLSTEDCEDIIEGLHGRRIIVNYRILCTVANPYVLLTYVCISSFIAIKLGNQRIVWESKPYLKNPLTNIWLSL
jgi:hypothetical protein